MPRPSKPVDVIISEGVSHRTKTELEERAQAEADTLTGIPITESKDVKKDKRAHKVFERITELLLLINKNDAMYEAVINRYCLITSECAQISDMRHDMELMVFDLRDKFKQYCTEANVEDAALILEFANKMAQLSTLAAKLDDKLLSKRKMLLDIEKECCMTVAAALRSIPKKASKGDEDDPMMQLLSM